MIEAAVELAGEQDVTAMRIAARGLASRDVMNVLGGAGVPAPRGLSSVPRGRVHHACQALRIAVRSDIRSPVAPHIGGHSGLEHDDCLDGWPFAPAAELSKLRAAADGLWLDQIRTVLAVAGRDPGEGLKGVPPADVEAVCAALSAHPRLGQGRVS